MKRLNFSLLKKVLPGLMFVMLSNLSFAGGGSSGSNQKEMPDPKQIGLDKSGSSSSKTSSKQPETKASHHTKHSSASSQHQSHGRGSRTQDRRTLDRSRECQGASASCSSEAFVCAEEEKEEMSSADSEEEKERKAKGLAKLQKDKKEKKDRRAAKARAQRPSMRQRPGSLLQGATWAHEEMLEGEDDAYEELFEGEDDAYEELFEGEDDIEVALPQDGVQEGEKDDCLDGYACIGFGQPQTDAEFVLNDADFPSLPRNIIHYLTRLLTNLQKLQASLPPAIPGTFTGLGVNLHPLMATINNFIATHGVGFNNEILDNFLHVHEGEWSIEELETLGNLLQEIMTAEDLPPVVVLAPAPAQQPLFTTVVLGGLFLLANRK